MQTPQVFQVDLIKAALVKALEDGARPDRRLRAVERLGIGVSLTQGDYCNLKITTRRIWRWRRRFHPEEQQ